MIYKKSVILAGVSNKDYKAVVNLNNKNGEVVGEVKLYNFQKEPDGVLTLGLLIEGKVHKAGLTKTQAMHYGFNSVLKEIPHTFTCAVIEIKNGKTDALLYGGSSINSKLEEGLIQSLSALNMKKIEDVKAKLNENIGDYEDKEEIEKTIDKCMANETDKCLNCQYKKAFYEVQEQKNEQPEIVKGKLRLPESNNERFIDSIGKQIEKLFETYPEEETLEQIIPNSRWVKVDYNGDNKYYVVGIIYNNDIVEYLCYGVPGINSNNPPENFNKNAQFLPLSTDNPEGEGYWITYQNAEDGNLIQIEIIWVLAVYCFFTHIIKYILL